MYVVFLTKEALPVGTGYADGVLPVGAGDTDRVVQVSGIETE